MNSSNIPEKYKNEAESMFEKAPTNVKSLRGMAFAILGLYYYNKAKPSRKNTMKIKSFADALVSAYDKSSSKDWHWFEDCLTYSNSRLPDALFCAYLATQDKRYLNVAKSSLDFLSSITFENDKYVPIGQDGWYLQNRKRAHFDQQPVEASSMVQTLLTAHKVTNNMDYLRNAVRAFHWFLGQNHLNQIIYDETTGGCYDGIGKFTINLNQGAESTISYLIARLSLQKLRSQE